jgi:tRNA dimethylallyltransferase
MAKSHEPHSGLLCLAGATATGKSEVALLLAEKLGGEIISVDSMQVYRGLNIGTAKPGPAERACVPHHLIDVVDLNEAFDAAQFARLAHAVVQDVQARGKLPILCGGTGLYFKAFLKGVGDAPPADAKLRAELEATPPEELLRELERRDPATFAKIDRKNPRRVIRALEVIRLTGKPFSEQRAEWNDLMTSPLSPNSGVEGKSAVASERSTMESASASSLPRSPKGGEGRGEGADCSVSFFGLFRQPADLHVRINARVDLMFRRGLVEEVRGLLTHGLAENRTAMQAIGYRQVVEHLRGERDLAETIELVKIRTRQFAKRQMTWFRRHAQVKWLAVGAEDSGNVIETRIMEALKSAGTNL